MVQRTSLVKAFRALVDAKSKSSWNTVVLEAEKNVGMIDANDAHSILVAIAKALKSPVREIHPVRVAQFTIRLVDRILKSPDASFRTKAGTFGLVGRVGIDWSKHVSDAVQSNFFNELAASFKNECETHLTSSIDPQTIGYCCESAVLLNLFSDNLTSVVRDCLLSNPFIPALALVQFSHYLEHICGEDDLWMNITERIMTDTESFTGQNLVAILASMRSNGFSNPDCIRNVCSHLKDKAGTLRFSDCVSLLESVSQSAGHVEDVADVYDLVRSIRRRATVLIITSPTRIPAHEIMRLSGALHALSIPTQGPLAWITSSYPLAQLSAGGSQFITS